MSDGFDMLSFEDNEQKSLYEISLRILGGSTEENPMKTADLIDKIFEEVKYDPSKKYTIYPQIQKAANINGSQLKSRKGRNGGYFRSPSESTIDPSEKKASPPPRIEEQFLYDPVAKWLSEVKSVDRVSSKHANLTGGGKWSNPDVIGLSISKDLGFFEVEISTAEVKPSESNWRQWLFEAVSHKRFSERTYFVFRDSGGVNSEERAEILRYGEKFNVGIVELQIDADATADLSSWSEYPTEKQAEVLDAFVELLPAPYDPVPVRDKVQFLRRLGIDSELQIYNFGEGTS